MDKRPAGGSSSPHSSVKVPSTNSPGPRELLPGVLDARQPSGSVLEHTHGSTPDVMGVRPTPVLQSLVEQDAEQPDGEVVGEPFGVRFGKRRETARRVGDRVDRSVLGIEQVPWVGALVDSNRAPRGAKPGATPASSPPGPASSRARRTGRAGAKRDPLHPHLFHGDRL